MANFRCRIASGVTLQPWEDPLSGSLASRLNPQPEHDHKRFVGALGVQIELACTVGGVDSPLDGALGGELFIASFHETPGSPPPPFSTPAGQSSVQRFTPDATGHYTVLVSRENGGGVIHHIDVDP